MLHEPKIGVSGTENTINLAMFGLMFNPLPRKNMYISRCQQSQFVFIYHYKRIYASSFTPELLTPHYNRAGSQTNETEKQGMLSFEVMAAENMNLPGPACVYSTINSFPTNTNRTVISLN